MGLMSELKANDKKNLFTSDDNFVNYSTGILPLDYANGFWLEIVENGVKRHVPIIGIIGGTFISVIGTTGSGKTTLADQIAFNIIKDFEDGTMHHIDAERTALKHRIIQITGAHMEDERIQLSKTNTSVEDVLEMINKICTVKESGGDLYKYEVKNRSYNGKSFKAYIPTVFVIDSLPSFNSREYNVEDLGTNMDQARSAKDISRFYNNCLDRMQKYNITIITINHIRPKVETNQYQQAPQGLMMMRPGETLVRGYVSQYMSQNYFRLNALKSNMYTKEDNGFDGVKASIQLAKSKTNFIGATLDICFNKDLGFDPIYTLYEYASSIGVIQGRNPYLYAQGLETMKFNRKDFRNKFLGEKVFREAFLEVLRPHLESLLGSKEMSSDEKVRYGDLIREQEEMTKMDDIENEQILIEEQKVTKKKK